MLLFIGWTLASPTNGQDSFAGIDLLYPEFAHPQGDALAAIKRLMNGSFDLSVPAGLERV